MKSKGLERLVQREPGYSVLRCSPRHCLVNKTANRLLGRAIRRSPRRRLLASRAVIAREGRTSRIRMRSVLASIRAAEVVSCNLAGTAVL
jgi:hypothetical protein